MSVVASRELPRTWEKEVGKGGLPVRRFVVTLSSDTTQGSPTTHDEIFSAIGINGPVGTFAHPEYSSYKNRKVRLEEGYEGNPFETLVTIEYGLVSSDETTFPASRVAKWSAEASTIEVPALFYYDGYTQKPLTNSAGDYFQGLTTLEPIVRLRYEKNYAAAGYFGSGFPTGVVNAMNHVNGSAWAGYASHTCRVESVSVAYEEEEFSNAIYRFWALTATIAYRQSTWNLKLPDVGWNSIGGNGKQRAMVWEEKSQEWIQSPNPIGLNGSGLPASAEPAVLDRRVCPEASFSSLFGSGPA